MDTLKLYRPVGLKELELILLSDARKYPPRLNWQPIFYPVLNFEYARQVAYDWNVNDENSGFCGFVTAVEVESAYLQQFDIQTVGLDIHKELWIPANELENFNNHISGCIQVEAAYYHTGKYIGLIESSKKFKGLQVMQQWFTVKNEFTAGRLSQLIEAEPAALQINYPYWKKKLELLGSIDISFIEAFEKSWRHLHPERQLTLQTEFGK